MQCTCVLSQDSVSVGYSGSRYMSDIWELCDHVLITFSMLLLHLLWVLLKMLFATTGIVNGQWVTIFGHAGTVAFHDMLSIFKSACIEIWVHSPAATCKTDIVVYVQRDILRFFANVPNGPSDPVGVCQFLVSCVNDSERRAERISAYWTVRNSIVDYQKQLRVIFVQVMMF